MNPDRAYADRASLVAALRERLFAQCRQAIAQRGTAVIALSGGSTPLPLYRAFGADALDWPRVLVALVDERWVPLDHAASNESALRAALAPALTAGARLVGMKTAALRARDGLAVCETLYRALPLPFDTVILGMGEDGHTASLFPHAAGLAEAVDPAGDRLCAAIEALRSDITGACTERMSLTVPALCAARSIELMIAGERKRKVLGVARGGTDVTSMPVRTIVNAPELPLTVWWAP
jgi:6-phosphogluconolactonase